MQKIDLKKIIKQRELDVAQVASQLFPNNKYSRLALNRVIQGKALLNSAQISKLALIANLDISELYGIKWKSTTKGSIMTLTTGDYVAILDTRSWITKVLHKNSLFHESIIHNGSTPLSMYLSKISDIIEKHKD